MTFGGALLQLLYNLLLLSDKTLNALLLGDPNEPLSRRIARARDAGSVSACRACAVLTFVFSLIGPKRDHCTWSLEPGSIGREIWAWSPAQDAQKTIEIPHVGQ
jgi:hypothetical protein